MNVRRTLNLLGLLLLVLAGAQLVPLAMALWLGEASASRGFFVGLAATAALGGAFRRAGEAGGELYRREGVLIVVGAWVLASASGAVPYAVSGAIPGVADALFESASGFTTTGASIVTNIEALPRSILFWRSLTQWLGGIGIVVLFVALLGELGPGARFLFKLEVPGPKAEILHARVRGTALAVLRIYLAMSALQIALLAAFGLGVYDALTLTFSTVSTGGFSPYANSAAHFSEGVQLVVTLFMVGAGVNFSLYYALLRRRSVAPLRDVELRVYLLLILAASLLLGVDLTLHPDLAGDTPFLDAWFQVVSLLTTTGFATVDFERWPEFTRGLLVMLMLVGGCAGSTAGGAKVIRVLVAWRAALREVRLTFSPHSVIAIAIGGRAIPDVSVHSVTSFLVLWMFSVGAGTILLSVGDTGLVTAATAAIATLANIGPGLEAVGPAESYALFADWQKLLMVLLMWLGRLEFFALLAVFQRQFWRRSFARR